MKNANKNTKSAIENAVGLTECRLSSHKNNHTKQRKQNPEKNKGGSLATRIFIKSYTKGMRRDPRTFEKSNRKTQKLNQSKPKSTKV